MKQIEQPPITPNDSPYPSSSLIGEKLTQPPTLHLNRRKAIASKCLDCSCFNYVDRQKCPFGDCQLYQFRTGRGKQNPRARNMAIRSFCRDFCMEGCPGYVSACSSPDCPLYAFRQTAKGKGENNFWMPSNKNH